MILTIVIVFLIGTAIGYGLYECYELDIIVEFKLYNNPYYRIGISFNNYPDADEFVIGLFFFSIIAVFYKNKT